MSSHFFFYLPSITCKLAALAWDLVCHGLMLFALFSCVSDASYFATTDCRPQGVEREWTQMYPNI